MKAFLKRLPLLLVLVGMVVGVAFSFRPTPHEVDLGEVTEGEMKVTVDEDGKTRIMNVYVVAAPLSGRMARIDLKPGTKVGPGTVLTTIQPNLPSLLDARTIAEAEARVDAAKQKIEQAKVGVQSAEDAVEQAKANLKRAEADVRYTRTEYARLHELQRMGNASDQELNSAYFQAQRAEQDELAASAALKMAGKEAENATVAVRIAEHELKLAKAALLLSKGEKLSSQSSPYALEVTPPKDVADGVVLRVHKESASNVNAGQELIEIGDPTELEVVVDVLSEDAVKISEAQQKSKEVEVELHNWGGREKLKAKVRHVEPSAFTKLSALGVEEQRVNVIIDLKEKPKTLKDGFRVEASIVIWESKQALRVPIGALAGREKSQVVFVVEGDQVHKREVKIDHRNGQFAEVVSGLKKGERVVLYPDDKIKDGLQVTPRQ